MAIERVDLIMETVSAIISFSVAYYSMKAFKITQNRSLMYLYYGFSILGACMLTRVIATTYIVALARSLEAKTRILVSTASLIYGAMRTASYALFVLAYITRAGGEPKLETAIIAPIILNPYFEFIEVALLIYVVAQSAINFIELKNANSLLIFSGFTLILISHLAFMYSIIMKPVYVLAHILQLLGFTSMLIMLLRVGR